MTGRTHDLAAFTTLVAVFVYAPIPEMTLATAVVAFGANFIGGLFPDIDQPTSDFWDNFRLGPFIAKLVCPALGGHRHISHSILGFFLTGLLSWYALHALARIILVDMQIVWLAFMLGVASHYIGDLLTKDGLPLLWPLKWKFGIPPIRRLRITSGNWIENYVIFPALLLLTGYLIHEHYGKILEFFKLYMK